MGADPYSLDITEHIKLDNVPVVDCYSLRGKELKKLDIKWDEPEELWNLPSRDGWRVMRLHTPIDTAILGRIMGHCSGGHRGLVCDYNIWHFLTLFDEHDAPHATIHMMDGEWFSRPPEDCPVPVADRYAQVYHHLIRR